MIGPNPEISRLQMPELSKQVIVHVLTQRSPTNPARPGICHANQTWITEWAYTEKGPELGFR